MKTQLKFKTFAILLLSFALLSQVSAWEYVTIIPEGMTIDQYKTSVSEANNMNKATFFSFRNTMLSEPTAGGWGEGMCDYYGTFYPKDCEDPCDEDEIESNCFYSPDSVSSTECSGKSRTACYTISLEKYGTRFMNKQCLCTEIQDCPGGYEPGERKCSGDDVYKCEDTGEFEFVKSCDYGCDDGSCESNPCQSHTEQKCYGNSIYWYDSCGTREEEYIKCASDETCPQDKCIKQCTEQSVGEKYCEVKDVKQQFQKTDCSTEVRTLETCASYQNCESGTCIDKTCETCPPNEVWTECINGQMSRSAYTCDRTTDYQCVMKDEVQNCNCDTHDDCNEDEICDLYVCKPLVCEEGEVLQNHRCIQGPNPILLYGVIGILVLSAIVVFVVFRKRKKH